VIRKKAKNMNKELPQINFLGNLKRRRSRLRKQNPRALGTNPRALGTNPNSLKKGVQV